MSLPLILIGASILHTAYWSSVDKQAKKASPWSEYYTMRMYHRGKSLVCDKNIQKCFTVNAFGSKGSDPYDESF